MEWTIVDSFLLFGFTGCHREFIFNDMEFRVNDMNFRDCHIEFRFHDDREFRVNDKVFIV